MTNTKKEDRTAWKGHFYSEYEKKNLHGHPHKTHHLANQEQVVRINFILCMRVVTINIISMWSSLLHQQGTTQSPMRWTTVDFSKGIIVSFMTQKGSALSVFNTHLQKYILHVRECTADPDCQRRCSATNAPGMLWFSDFAEADWHVCHLYGILTIMVRFQQWSLFPYYGCLLILGIYGLVKIQ